MDPPKLSSSSSSKETGDKRSSCEDLDAKTELGPKRVRMRDLGEVLQSEGIHFHSFESTTVEESSEKLNSKKETGPSRTTEAIASLLSHGSESAIVCCSSLSSSMATSGLTLGPAGSAQSHLDLASDATLSNVNESSRSDFPANEDQSQEASNNRTDFPTKMDRGEEASMLSSPAIKLDLNATGVSSMLDYNSFSPYKKLDTVRYVDFSECGSTGHSEDDGSLKTWKEMKQNDFILFSHEGIPFPKQRGCRPKKRKEDDLKKNIELAKREQVNRFSKIAAPSGLLSGLNPGIINHVRNSKQVHSIIKAVVRSEKLDGQFDDHPASRFSLSLDRRSLLSKSEGKCEVNAQNITEERLSQKSHVASCFTSEHEDDTLAQKLSSAGTMALQNAPYIFSGDISGSQEIISSLSLKGANVASQWLELLYQDIKGRLAALKRSRKRVRHVIQTELPYLLSQHPSNQENNQHHGQSSDAGFLKNATSATHGVRWKTLFNKMDKALSEEGKHLASWLEQVNKMLSQCDMGLKHVNADGMPLVGLSECYRPSSSEDAERVCAVRAAAASIYSTCNMAVSTDNVPCF